MIEEFSTRQAAVALAALVDADENWKVETNQYKEDGAITESDDDVDSDTPCLNYSKILVDRI